MQVWYLIVSIPDLCNLTYFRSRRRANIIHEGNPIDCTSDTSSMHASIIFPYMFITFVIQLIFVYILGATYTLTALLGLRRLVYIMQNRL